MQRNKGFTLMEIIVVIAIISILAVITIPTVTGYVEEAKETSDLQVATNLITATKLAISLSQSELPSDAIVEVMWCTGYADNSKYKNWLIVREVSESWRKPSGYGSAKIESLENVQKLIIGTMGYTAKYDAALKSWYAIMDINQSKIASKNNLVFHINVGTGEVQAAYYTAAVDGVKNIWIDEIGVNMEPAD